MTRVFSAILVGVELELVEIEVAVGRSFSGLALIGLPQDAARDMRERIRAALESVQKELPARRITVSFSPPERIKLSRLSAGLLDFAVAVGVMRAIGKKSEVQPHSELFLGELTLSGALRPLPSHLNHAALQLATNNNCALKTAPINQPENGATTQSFDCLKNWLAFSSESITVNQSYQSKINQNTAAQIQTHQDTFASDNTEQIEAIILELAQNPGVAVAILASVAGRLPLLLAGSPGVGKSHAIKLIPALLPPLIPSEMAQLQLIYAEHPRSPQGRPFRMPHHSTPAAALIGSAGLKPSEVTLSHRGVLFLDELAEFSRPTLEALREPLDEGRVHIARAAGTVSYPCDFLLVAATNPCPCGLFLSRLNPCRCRPSDLKRYQGKLSGPLLDRFVIQRNADFNYYHNISGNNTNNLSSNTTALKDPYEHNFLQLIQNPDSLKKFASRFVKTRNKSWTTDKGGTKLNSSTTSKHGSTNNALRETHSQSLRSVAAIDRLNQILIQLFPEVESAKPFPNALHPYRNLESLLFSQSFEP